MFLLFLGMEELLTTTKNLMPMFVNNWESTFQMAKFIDHIFNKINFKSRVQS